MTKPPKVTLPDPTMSVERAIDHIIDVTIQAVMNRYRNGESSETADVSPLVAQARDVLKAAIAVDPKSPRRRKMGEMTTGPGAVFQEQISALITSRAALAETVWSVDLTQEMKDAAEDIIGRVRETADAEYTLRATVDRLQSSIGDAVAIQREHAGRPPLVYAEVTEAINVYARTIALKAMVMTHEDASLTSADLVLQTKEVRTAARAVMDALPGVAI